jgi:large subunit ribosomal protein L10
MAITKQKKVEILEKLNDGLKGAETVAFVKFDKLTVKDATALRRDLRNAGVSYYVAKKTLVKRALSAQGVTGDMPELVGELALAWSKDPIAPAKGIFEFAKTHKDQMSLLGGVYQGKYLSKDEIMGMATIPSREGLYTQFVGMLNETIARVVRVIDQKAKVA